MRSMSGNIGPSSSTGANGPSSSSAAGSGSSIALRNWQFQNSILDLPANDAFFQYDEEEQSAIRNAKPWDKDAHYFKEVKISAVALLKMVMHSRRGGNLEVMGLMQGRVDANSIIITDSFALPVEGTETRVNAQAQAYEYMTTYTELCENIGRKDKVVGWYHSHPGYGCWLSGIDVSTQSLNQQYQEPFVAVVIDPIRTMSAGKVEIGAFRTYPKGYKPPDEGRSEYQSIPLNKIDDFGVHCKSYYPLAVAFFKSALDAACLDSLWNTYWASTLSSSPLTTNATYINEQLQDLARKLRQVKASITRTDRLGEVAEKMDKAVLDAKSIGCELRNGMMMQELKRALFNRRQCCSHELVVDGSAPTALSCAEEAMATEDALPDVPDAPPTSSMDSTEGGAA